MFLLFHGRAYVKRRESLALFDGVEALPLNMSCSYAVAYTINLASAKKLLAACRPVHSIADWPIDISQLDAHITQPVLVQHPPDTSLSEIGKDRTRKAKDRKRYFKASYYLRRWLRWVSKRIEEEKLN